MQEVDFIIGSIGELTYGGIFILALLSNIIIPVPEELVLLGMGYLTSVGIFQYPLILGIFILGMLTSDYILYSLAKRGSKLTVGLFKKLEKKGFLKNKEYLKRNINKIIFFSRFLIYLRFIGPVVAGYVKTPRKKFLIYNFLALVIYVNIFLGLGNYFHKEISTIAAGVARFKNYMFIFLVIMVSILVLRYIEKNFITWITKISEYIPAIIPPHEGDEEETAKK